MSQNPKRPVPIPRKHLNLQNNTEDNEASTPTNHPKGVPPPVLPKKWSCKMIPESEPGERRLKITKIAEKSVTDNDGAQPHLLPPIAPKQELDMKKQDAKPILKSDLGDSLCKDDKHPMKVISTEANHLYKAIKFYNILLAKHNATLKEYTSKLHSIADNLDKVSKRTKIAGITGGATTIAGGVAAAAGVILSPVTLGASLALTAVGVGVAAAGGVTGASAAIAHGVNASFTKKKINKTLQEYRDLMANIIDHLKVINERMEQLKLHDLSILCDARRNSVRVTSMINLATRGASARALEANSKAFGQIEGFALAMDFYFTQEKNEQKLKKGLESKFAQKIRKLAEKLDNGLDELTQVKDLFSEHCQGV